MNSKTVLVKVGRKKSHREALKMNLLSDLVIYEYVTTTRAKSQLVSGEFDKLVTIATSKKDDREKSRQLMHLLHNENAVAKLLEVYSKRFASEKSGFIKLYKVGNRKGDNAELVKMIVKGYVYKDIGKKVSDKPAAKSKKAKAEDKSKAVVTAEKNLSSKEQVKGAGSAAKVKTRSGI